MLVRICTMSENAPKPVPVCEVTSVGSPDSDTIPHRPYPMQLSLWAIEQ